ncbi:hypothetical protein ZOD2009_08853 [Haladaptatus paucihalophilus DX253]|uniref:DUF4203 domain-containing protein n=1 Tax=Haladaptatus paucihalophilus DX253 TaxID=797209 RepID=E7QSJ5_HALPU|nr:MULTISPECIES: hypothetical protein [Haladaptatus]EFW92404.1 hypothetical protein ZOD2009_08853 [Haladaptatus paucihalophilus DX253]GKZ13363.1 hypothetical protein HAL_12440 [Haladaptatus sp. T7]SHK05199.1 hypothetical protein SAMN05444342_0408 [Haladaptatus paucihalophilus DX253]
MVPDFFTATVVALAVGVGLAFTYFGYSFVTQLTSLVGGLGGALFGSFAARTLAPALGIASPNLLLVSLVGALLGGLIGSRVAHSAQRFAIVGGSALAAASAAYASFGSGGVETIALPMLDGAADPLVGSLLVGGVTGILVWRFYLPFLTVVTSLLGATILQQLARQWGNVLPVFQADVWAMLGTNEVFWLLLVGSGVLIQYRRHRRLKSHVRLRRLSPGRSR